MYQEWINMTDRLLLEKKLRKIEEYLRELEGVQAPENFDVFSNNIIFKRFVERNIELSIEQMINICKHLVSTLDLSEPETYAQCFEIIGNANIIPVKTIDIFKSMARFRNLLIHAYDGVDDTITFDIYKKRLGDFRIFIKYIRAFFDK
ncbi:DUF86 domain-containing protein, partial [Desulfobacterales bacterium HSG17]|nr:DUF86 domain-containing protein [Desulfobacterales bacterium HSG17]